jgi:hypothetical protein
MDITEKIDVFLTEKQKTKKKKKKTGKELAGRIPTAPPSSHMGDKKKYNRKDKHKKKFD